jgi:uncharacterized protein YdhG (YjbR/CyaY superfamily)
MSVPIARNCLETRADGTHTNDARRSYVQETNAETIDDYIAAFPPKVRTRLKAMRTTIRKHAPDAVEKISYRIPTFYFNGNLVHFAGYEHHVGFYPGAAGVAKFRSAIKDYKSAKGSVQFPLDKPIPYALIARIVKFRVNENMARAATGKRRSTSSRRG